MTAKISEDIAQRAVNLAVLVERTRLQEKITALEDALIDALCGTIRGHESQAGYMTPTEFWENFEEDCEGCQRLDLLIGHRRPAS